MIRFRALAAVLAPAVAALVLTGAPAYANTTEPTSWDGANLLSYNDSDFENGTGNWVDYSNTTVSQSTTSFLHKHALKLTSGTSGSQAAKMGTSEEIRVRAGNAYRESAWVKTSGQSGRTITFADGFFNSSGGWLGWTSGSTVTLAAQTGFQYVQNKITAPSGAAYMLGSPRITEGGVSANESLWVDEVMVAPYRAATVIGAESGDGNCLATQWASDNAAIGPLQSCKIFYGQGSPIPSSYTGSICASLQADANVTCVISFKDGGANDASLKSFVASIPAGQNVVLIYWQEPEHQWDTNCPLSTCDGATYVSQFETEAADIRASVTTSNSENVFIASDAEAYQYDSTSDITSHPHHKGTDCSYIPPQGNSGSPDFYFMDQYELPPTSGGYNLGNEPAIAVGTETQNWLTCVSPYKHPLGVAEVGYNCGASSGNDANVQATTDNMAQDNTWLGGNPSGLPVVLYEYWYDNNVGCRFTGISQVNEWKSIETQNGGGAN